MSTVLEKKFQLVLILADLYLDTPVNQFAMATKLKKENISIIDIENVLKQIVHPMLYLNLLSPAGEWGAWSEEFLKDRYEKFKNKPKTLWFNPLFYYVWSEVKKDWLEVKQLMTQDSTDGLLAPK